MWAHPETTWRASANQRADRTLRLGFKQTTVRRERPVGPRPLAWVWGPARRRAGGGAESGGGAQWSSDGRSHLFGVRAAERWTPQPMGGGEGEGRPSRRGGGSPRPGDAGGGGGGLPIRFHPVLPPPPPRVSAARAAGGAAAVRLLRFAKALGAPRPSGTRLSPAPSPRCPRGRSAPPRGQRRRSPRGGRRGCQLNRLL